MKTKIVTLYDKIKKKENENCSICLDKITDNIDDMLVLPCNHVFHKNCINNWIIYKLNDNTRPNCPLCKQNIHIIKDIKIFNKNNRLVHITSQINDRIILNNNNII